MSVSALLSFKVTHTPLATRSLQAVADNPALTTLQIRIFRDIYIQSLRIIPMMEKLLLEEYENKFIVRLVNCNRLS